MGALRVTVLDIESGETETKDVPDNDWFILTTGRCYVSHVQSYPRTGTQQLTIKKDGGSHV